MTNFRFTFMEILATILVLVALFNDFTGLLSVNGHGRQVKPPGRSSLWRFSQFTHLGPPANYNDNQLYCGGVHQRDAPGRQCGICGDPVHQQRPRDNEIGGRFYKGIITTEYKSGDVIVVAAEITAPHMGYMEWRLCNNARWESQDCFDQYLLPIADGSGTRLDVGRETGIFWAKVKLPENVVCEHCVIQWNYRAGNNWGFCGNGEGKLGCGPQETFRGCSDVRIVPRTTSIATLATLATSTIKIKKEQKYNIKDYISALLKQ